MTKAESLKLFRYMSERFDSLEKRLESTATKEDVEKVWVTIDRMYGRYDQLDTEQGALDAKTIRLEDQIRGHELRMQDLEQHYTSVKPA